MVERRGLFLARKRLGLIWGGDLPWLNSLVLAKKPKSKKTKEIPWPNIRQSCISCSVMSPGMTLFFGQLTGQHSLRDLVTTLDAGRKKLQQVGLGAVSRSTLADANRKRPQEIFGELFCWL